MSNPKPISDFVTQLRAAADDASIDCYSMCEQAADRIEALEAALHDAFMAMCAQRDTPDEEVFQDAIDALGLASGPKSQAALKWRLEVASLGKSGEMSPRMRDLLKRRTLPFLDRAGLDMPLSFVLEEVYLQGMRDAVQALVERQVRKYK